jgi:hypothetical protein
MSKGTEKIIELGIGEDYCPHWSLWHAIRDLIQNYLDAQDRGSPSKYGIFGFGKMLELVNKNVDFSTSAFLIGSSSKRGDQNQRGEHGEGLKIALLVLTRLGHDVTIHYGSKAWKPRIVESKQFGCKVLALAESTHPGLEPETLVVRVRLKPGDAKEDFSIIRSRFLAFMLPQVKELRMPDGAILLDKDQAGKIYLKGIWVCDLPNMKFGYDFEKGTINVSRDRDSVTAWEVSYHAGSLISQALNAGSLSQNDIWEQIQSGAGDFANLHYYQTPPLKKSFQGYFGDSAVPVDATNIAAQQKITALGGIPVPLNSSAFSVVSKSFDTHKWIEEAEEKPLVRVFKHTERMDLIQNFLLALCGEEYGYLNMSFARFSGDKKCSIDQDTSTLYIIKEMEQLSLQALIVEIANIIDVSKPGSGSYRPAFGWCYAAGILSASMEDELQRIARKESLATEPESELIDFYAD